MRRATIIAALALLPALAGAQALPNLSSARVAYNTRKNTVNPQGELEAQIDEVDKAIAAAMRVGSNGEVRRQLAKGMVLLDGGAWTAALDYRHSLVLRSERTVIDSAQRYALRLEQIYSPTIELTSTLTTKVSIRERVTRARGQVEEPLPPAKALGTFDEVARDLREAPFAMELDLSAIPDGPFTIEAEVFDAAMSLGSASLNVSLLKNLDARLRAIEGSAASVPPDVRADVLYPIDYITNVNRGRVTIGTFNLAREVAAAEEILSAAKGGKDLFKGRVGDLERHYLLGGANEIMPYRVYVPKSYAAGRPTPLVIALHGLGGNEDSFFDQYAGTAPRLAEQHGFLMAAPNGYRVDGFYGSGVMAATDAASRRRRDLSEKDVLEVLARMRQHYSVDESRIYLLGHSMGGIGTWFLGAKHSQIWAALAAFAGAGAVATVEQMKHLPQFVVHGDADRTVPVSGSRSMVAEMKKQGMQVTYLEIASGGHSDVVAPNLPAAFQFFASHTKRRN